MNRKPDSRRWKMIKPEDIDKGYTYAFTFNPEIQPEHNGYKEKLDNFVKFDKSMTTLLGTMRHADVKVYMEISQAGRLHYHGYIMINDIVDFCFYDLDNLKKNGSYEIDFINDKEIWEEYVTKQRDIMEKWCVKKGLTYMINTIAEGKVLMIPEIEEVEYDEKYNGFFDIDDIDNI